MERALMTATPEILAAVDRLAFALATRGAQAPAPAHNRQPVTHMAAPLVLGNRPGAVSNAAPLGRPAAPVVAGGTFTLPRQDEAADTASNTARPCACRLPSETDATAPARAGRDTFQLPSEA